MNNVMRQTLYAQSFKDVARLTFLQEKVELVAANAAFDQHIATLFSKHTKIPLRPGIGRHHTQLFTTAQSIQRLLGF